MLKLFSCRLFNLGDELFDITGLHQIIECTAFHPFNGILHCGMAREHDHFDQRVCVFNGLECFKAVHAGHLYVEHDDVGVPAVEHDRARGAPVDVIAHLVAEGDRRHAGCRPSVDHLEVLGLAEEDLVAPSLGLEHEDQRRRAGDVLLLGRESAGLPDAVHAAEQCQRDQESGQARRSGLERTGRSGADLEILELSPVQLAAAPAVAVTSTVLAELSVLNATSVAAT